MAHRRLSRGLCAAAANLIQGTHPSLNALFVSAGAPGEPPELSHDRKWKEWLFRAGQDPSIDSLAVLGNILEEFMDAPPLDPESRGQWEQRRQAVVEALEADSLSYFRGGQVIPNENSPPMSKAKIGNQSMKPTSVEELLIVLVKGLPRAMSPLVHRRKGSVGLTFAAEYDIQDLLHAMLRPWVSDVRPEEFTPSYAGSSTRMDFLLPEHLLVIETKLVRDKAHGKRIGDELIIDMDHYRAHPACSVLWCVIYDPNHFIENASGLTRDLEGESTNYKGSLKTRVLVIQP